MLNDIPNLQLVLPGHHASGKRKGRSPGAADKHPRKKRKDEPHNKGQTIELTKPPSISDVLWESYNKATKQRYTMHHRLQSTSEGLDATKKCFNCEKENIGCHIPRYRFVTKGFSCAECRLRGTTCRGHQGGFKTSPPELEQPKP
jgi:hypothetical protein